jgi:hypothetical protein
LWHLDVLRDDIRPMERQASVVNVVLWHCDEPRNRNRSSEKQSAGIAAGLKINL